VTKRLDAIVVVDLEATCWETEPPPDQVQEIIEIGLCLLDPGTLERRDRRSLMIRPVRSEVSPFCTQLTTITPEMAAAGMTLEEACQILRKQLVSRDRPWATWGDWDRRILERACTETGVRYPFSSMHVNVKTWYALAHGMSSEPGLTEALLHAGIPQEGTHHRGDADAWNTAALLAAILRRGR
jgi:inhibitor of KinA sporulation pathway (predicted exonuclease)